MAAGLLVVGTGLLGTSVGLALRGDTDVLLTDREPSAVATASARGAGRPWDGVEPAEHVLLAVPPAVVAPELVRLQGLGVGRTWSHVCSVQAPVQEAAQAAGADLVALCGSHPMAGKESSGPAAASARGAGRPWDGVEPAEHVLLAVPPAVVAPELVRLQRRGVGRTWSHVCSVQAPVQDAAQAAGADLAALCGSHPMAGKESSGPAAASADLFLGRPWALCPSVHTGPLALAAARSLAERCGGVPLELPAEEHDRAVALASHLPQVTASALAAVLLARSSGEVRLAGPGLQDTSRIAASAPALWVEVLGQNAHAVAPLVRELAAELDRAAAALEALDRGAVEDLLVRGNAGRALVPVKRGGHDRDFAVVGVSVPDRPGQIAAVLLAAAEAGINVEDVRVDHLPGRPSGVVELLVATDTRAAARASLAAAGWAVLP